jgi:membrane protease YdiL (CAAX protease family)
MVVLAREHALRCDGSSRYSQFEASTFLNQDPENNVGLPQPEPSAEPEFAAAAPGVSADAALPAAGAPASDAHELRWLELLYLAAFYLIVGAVLAKLALVAAARISHTTEDELKEFPATYVAAVALSQALLSFAMLGFLWLLVRSRGTAPFWPTLGWRAFSSKTPHAALAVRLLLGGATLAIVIQLASFYMGSKASVPMEDFFRDRPSVLMMMALGILVAPLFEETLFRGCIYPVVARTFGMPVGILTTGVLFGLAHSLQLAGAWNQVALVSLVGVVLTYIRARTGTVLASFLVHVGYNSFLFGAFYFATGGLQNFPGS